MNISNKTDDLLNNILMDISNLKCHWSQLQNILDKDSVSFEVYHSLFEESLKSMEEDIKNLLKSKRETND
jgi:hypothetical protein